MSKLTTENAFFDLSDYGRPIATFIANKLKGTFVTPVHVTLVFGLCGLLAVYFILNGNYKLAGAFLIIKSIIDAVDGTLARLNQKPSYIGRYLDSIFDFVLNALTLAAIGYMTLTPIYLILAAFFALQLQGTLYNFYYVILRTNSVGGDATSQIFEQKTPSALHGENQKIVDWLFKIYLIFYGIFDKIIYNLDYSAHKVKTLPKWFMTAVSCYGLGFQLLIMAFLLALNKPDWIIPFFIGYSALIFVFIAIRRWIIS